MISSSFSVTVTETEKVGGFLPLITLRDTQIVKESYMGVMDTMKMMRMAMLDDEIVGVCRLVAKNTAKQ